MESRVVRAAVLALALVVAGAGTAAAVSDGNYRHRAQHCSGRADLSDQPDHTEPGCQSAALSVHDGKGGELVRVGTQQTPDGTPADFTHPTVTHGSADPSSGLGVYFGADDNLDNGEHDSSDAVAKGPSDGGGIRLTADPASPARWTAALRGADLAYLLTHPVPLVSAGFGACADGLCFSVESQRQVAYQGGDPSTHRDVANYAGKEWDPKSCAGPSDTEADCGPGGLAAWNDKEGTTYVEPGVQVYEDPDPEGSPAGPYPLPGVYAGTCGVVAGGGIAPPAPASPVTNSAGQVVVPTKC